MPVTGACSSQRARKVNASRLNSNSSLSTQAISEFALAAAREDMAQDHRSECEHDRQSRQPRGRRFTTGLMQRRIDRERHGARFTGDIADEGHRRTELAERTREAQD